MDMGIKPSKQMASGGSIMTGIPRTRTNNDDEFSMTKGPDFGVSPVLGGVPSVNHMDRDHVPSHMPDEMRGARPPIPGGTKRHHNQANPDHGPHHMSIVSTPMGHVTGLRKPSSPNKMSKMMRSSY